MTCPKEVISLLHITMVAPTTQISLWQDLFTWSVSCTPDHTFQWQVYELPQLVIDALSKVKTLQAGLVSESQGTDEGSQIGLPWVTQVHYLPVQLHALALATFASLIAPFGGFFASGFKRGLQIKVCVFLFFKCCLAESDQDFGESIPGHGGITDRMDCQVLACARWPNT